MFAWQVSVHDMATYEVHLAVPLDIRDVLEESNHNREDEHEAHGKDKRPGECYSAALQDSLHVEVET